LESTLEALVDALIIIDGGVDKLILPQTKWVSSFGTKKLTLSSWCESLSNLGRKSNCLLQEPKTSSPSKWGILQERPFPLVITVVANFVKGVVIGGNS
jgi:hypothetical protein